MKIFFMSMDTGFSPSSKELFNEEKTLMPVVYRQNLMFIYDINKYSVHRNEECAQYSRKEKEVR